MITIDTPFTQAASGNTVIDLGGASTGQFGQINVSSAVTLDGTLTVNLINGFTPASGDSFRVMTYNAVSGSFATIHGPTLTGGLVLTTVYDTAGLTLDVK